MKLINSRISRRKGTTAEIAGYTGVLAEIVVDTTKLTAVIMDGSTPGGHYLAKASDIQLLQESLDEYRSKSEKINESDLADIIITKLNSAGYDDTQIRMLLADISTTKLGKDEAAGLYRPNSEPIEESDLSLPLQVKINNTGSGTSYDDTELRSRVANVESGLNSKVDASVIDVLNAVDMNLQTAVNSKADIAALNNYRDKVTAIAESDLTPELTAKINAVETGYDDTAVKADIASLQSTVATKADTSLLDNYRDKSVSITETDLDEALVGKINAVETGYDDTAVKADIASLQSTVATKADASELSNYRDKATTIAESDLDQTVIDKLNAGGSSYDDTAVKADITSLQTSKADITALDNYRDKVTPIAESDLSTELVGKINAVETGYDDTAVKADIASLQTSKADITALDNYRDKVTKIDEIDLTQTVIDKLNASGSSYDDTAVKADITSLQTTVATKADASELSNYRDKVTAIAESDLTPELTAKINAVETGYDDTAVKADIASLQTSKADATALANYRDKATSIVESDLDQTVIDKLNASGTSYDDTVVKADITSLQSTVTTKADTSLLDNYRDKTTKIDEVDLTQTVIDKLNASNAYDDTAVKADIASLQTNKVDTTVLVDYRDKATKIEKSDLASDVLVMNHADIQNLNADDLYIHITKSDKAKYDGYDTIIQSLMSRISALESASSGSPVIENTLINGSTGVTLVSNIQYKITSAVTSPTVTLDTSKITCDVPTTINTAGITVDNATMMLNIPVTLTYATSYTITIAPNAVMVNGKGNETEIVTTFTTMAEGSNPIDWSVDFTIPTGTWNCKYKLDPNFTPEIIAELEDPTNIYGPNEDGKNCTIELYFVEYDGWTGAPLPLERIPKEGLETLPAGVEVTNKWKLWTWMPDPQAIITMAQGVPTAAKMRIIKYTNPQTPPSLA